MFTRFFVLRLWLLLYLCSECALHLGFHLRLLYAFAWILFRRFFFPVDRRSKERENTNQTIGLVKRFGRTKDMKIACLFEKEKKFPGSGKQKTKKNPATVMIGARDRYLSTTLDRFFFCGFQLRLHVYHETQNVTGSLVRRGVWQ